MRLVLLQICHFGAMGAFYAVFDQTLDEEVKRLLETWP